MKIKDGFELKKIADNFVVIPTRDNVVDFSSIIMLNETSAFLWLRMESDTTEEKLIDSILGEYDVDKKTAEADVKKFVSELVNAGVVED